MLGAQGKPASRPSTVSVVGHLDLTKGRDMQHCPGDGAEPLPPRLGLGATDALSAAPARRAPARRSEQCGWRLEERSILRNGLAS